jgi:hypothetical protein
MRSTVSRITRIEFGFCATASATFHSSAFPALRNAVTQLTVWLDSGLPAMTMAVNLSSMQFRHPNLPELIRQILADANIPPHYLELELIAPCPATASSRGPALVDRYDTIYTIISPVVDRSINKA